VESIELWLDACPANLNETAGKHIMETITHLAAEKKTPLENGCKST